MKYATLLLAFAATSQAIKLNWRTEGADDIDIPDEDDPFIVVPAQAVSVHDAKWGHEVERRGHNDWLDEHVIEVRKIKDWVGPPPDKEDKKAIYDS